MSSLRDVISIKELMTTMDRLNKMVEAEKQERAVLEKGLQEENTIENQREDYLNEPGILNSIRTIAREISELEFQKNNLYSKSIKNRKVLPEIKEQKTKEANQEAVINKIINEMEENNEMDFYPSQQPAFEKKKGFVSTKNVQKNNKIAELQQKKLKEEMKEVQDRPKITNNSRIMAFYKTNNVPISERYKDELKKRNEKVENLRKKLEKEKERKERTITPDFSKNNRNRSVSPFKSTATSAFSGRSKQWEEKKELVLMRKRHEKLAEEMRAMTFQPQINPKSKALMEFKDMEETSKDSVTSRLYQDARQKEKLKKEMERQRLHSFRPVLNMKSLKIVEDKKKMGNDQILTGYDTAPYEYKRSVTPEVPKSQMMWGRTENRDSGRESPDLYSKRETEEEEVSAFEGYERNPRYEDFGNTKTPSPRKNLPPPSHYYSSEGVRQVTYQRNQKNEKVFVNQFSYSPELDFLIKKLDMNN